MKEAKPKTWIITLACYSTDGFQQTADSILPGDFELFPGWKPSEDDYQFRVCRLSELEAAQKEIAELKKERTAYRTLNALVGDNAEKCELYDDIEALEAKLNKTIEALKVISKVDQFDTLGVAKCIDISEVVLEEIE